MRNGNPTAPITNEYTNFGWEYVYHCHILCHEEMDMMRPVSVMLPPNKPAGLAGTVNATGKKVATLTWQDTSLNETRFLVQTAATANGPWTTLTTINRPLDPAVPNTTGPMSYVDTTYKQNTTTYYRVVAQNVVGYGGAYMQQTVQSVSNVSDLLLAS